MLKVPAQTHPNSFPHTGPSESTLTIRNYFINGLLQFIEIPWVKWGEGLLKPTQRIHVLSGICEKPRSQLHFCCDLESHFLFLMELWGI